MAAVKFGSVLVTGSSRGIGLELVRQLAASPNAPDQIFAACRDPDGTRAKVMRDLAQKHSKHITIISLDTSDSRSITAASELVGSCLKNGELNVVINNAAVLCRVPLQELSMKDVMQSYATNVVGPLLMAKAFLPYLQKAALHSTHKPRMSCKRAAIINISTIFGSIEKCPESFGTAQLYPYRTSKAALNMLTRCLAEDFRKDGILVTAIHPGWVKTDMGGTNADLAPEDSVRGILQLMSSLQEKDSGTFLDWKGNSVHW